MVLLGYSSAGTKETKAPEFLASPCPTVFPGQVEGSVPLQGPEFLEKVGGEITI